MGQPARTLQSTLRAELRAAFDLVRDDWRAIPLQP
jgi:hypothetical protein